MKNLISIIMPVKNGARYLSEALDGIQRQQMPVEVVLVDDGSTDQTAAIALRRGCVVVKQGTSRGPIVAKNSGLRIATGDFILFHDGDDVLVDGALSALSDALVSDPKVYAVMAKARDFLSPDVLNQSVFFHPEPYFGVLSAAALIRRSAFDVIGAFDETLKAGDVIAFQEKMRVFNLPIRKVDLVTVNRRIHDANFGRTNRQQEYHDYVKILRSKIMAHQGCLNRS